ncbi:MAG TPA: carbohydrate-binding domain-containing protein, partial [Bacteroidales bacterium]|nr:carbohydrate-binding domain-containing protein [Bacteroidales bacterium]
MRLISLSALFLTHKKKAICDANGNIVTGTVKIERTKYDLWLCGTQVTSGNKNELNVIPGVSGTVTYNHDTKTLTLNNANLSMASGANTIKSQIDGLTINVQGTNNVSSDDYATVRFEKSATITGGGTLNVSQNKPNQPGWSIYAHNNSSLTIKTCTVNTTNGSAGIIGSKGGTLTIDNAYISASSSGESVSRFADIVLRSAAIMEPAGAVVSTGSDTFKAVRNASGAILSGTVTIEPFYDLWICGKQATPQNIDNLEALTVGASGTLKYDPANKKLTMNNLVILDFTTNINEPRIKSNIEGLTIEILGNDNNIYNGLKGIELNGATTITGGGKLRLSNSGYEFGIHSTAQLTIRSCTVDVVSQNGGITGNGTNKLTIDNATVTANATNAGVITNFGNIVLKNSLIAAPQGVMVSKASDSFFAFRHNLTGNVIVNQQINIVPGTIYDLWINGVQVNSQNKDNLTVIPGVTAGTISYNPTSKTLTLNNANINMPDGANAIKSGIEALNIDVQGDNNSVNSNGWATMRFDKSATIKGSGKLNVSHSAIQGWTIFASGNSVLTIDGCTVNATSTGRSITGDDNGTLTINNATVTSTGPNGSITHFANINLNGCAISEPTGASVSKGADIFYAVRNADGNIITETVKILPGTAYNLFICGVQVTSVNKDDLTVINGYNGCTVSGGVSYNPVTRTLTLNGATITKTNGDAINCDDGGVNIELIGDNTVTSYGTAIDFDILRGQAPGSIYGSGTLNASSTNEIAIETAVPLTIKNCTVTATGKENGILGYSNNKLTIDGATVSATGTDLGSIFGFSELSLLNCAIVQPLKAVYDATQKAIVADGNVVKTQVDIVPGYGLWICGTQVTDANRADLTAIPGVSGTAASYDPATNTLSLNAATISSASNAGAIFSKIEGMKIELTGNSSVTSTVQDVTVYAIEFYGTASNTIEGSDTLNAKANGGKTIKVLNTLDINNCTLNVTGIFMGNGTSSQLNFLNANVSVIVGEGAFPPVQGFATVNFTDCGIVQPAGAAFNPGLKQICDKNGNPVLSDIRIEPIVHYNLWIAGIKVSNLDKDDLTLIPGVTGTASYDPATHTLRLENANITSSDASGGIYSLIDGLQIELIGTNRVEATNSVANGVYLALETTIKGGGTLNVEALNTAIRTEARHLTIMNCMVNAVGEQYGINGFSSDYSRLAVKNATLSATGAGRGSISGFRVLDLYSCKFTQPVGAFFNAGYKAVFDANGIVKTTVKIEPTYGLTICGVEVTDANKDDLTAIPGVTGTASFNAQTKTLRLENAVITSTTADAAIRADSDTLKIELAGNNNKVTASGQNNKGIYLFVDDATIYGNGKLSIDAPAEAVLVEGVNASNPAALTLKDIMLTAVGGYEGIYGRHSKLILDGATVSATGSRHGSIVNFNSIDFKDCKILSPASAVFNPTVKAVCDAQGYIIKSEVKIIPAYELYICGVQVTALNQNDLTVINGTNGSTVSGSVKYIPETKTLRLDGAAITATISDAIRSINGGINIELIGNNTVTGLATAIKVEKSGEGKLVTICGGGTLNANAGVAIETDGGVPLTIRNCTINATGGTFGIECGDTLTIDGATVSAIGTAFGSIYATKHLQLINCMVSQPAGAAYDATQYFICDANGVVKSEVKIIPTYDLTICGVQVTALNKDDLTVINGTDGCTVSGSVKFIPETNTLRLENANIRSTTNNGISNLIDGLKIEVIGNSNTVESANDYGIIFRSSGSIEGGGSLTVNALIYSAIGTYSNNKIAIKNCTVTANGGEAGIYGAYGNLHLIIDNATVSATGTNNGSIIGFEKLTLNHCVIAQPTDAVFDAGAEAVINLYTREVIKTEVKIVPGYELEICGERVTPSNMNDLTVINGTNGCTVTGSVKYIPETNTLRLDGATINSGSGSFSAVASRIDGMKIELTGTNTITSNNSMTMNLTSFDKRKTFTIEGGGTLNVLSNLAGIITYDSLTIKNCTVAVTGGDYGIAGGDVNNCYLVIDNAAVSAAGTAQASIAGFNDIEFIGSKLVEPSGALFNPAHYAICDSQGNPIKALVRIIPAYNLWVCGEQVTADNKDDLTVINGTNGCTVSGSVKYIPETNTLRLENAYISATTNIAIRNSIDGLKIEVIGNSNTVESADNAGIEFYNSGSIEGGGSLTVNAPNLAAIYTYNNNVKITIKNCTVTANGGEAGINGTTSNLHLIIDNATVSATGTNLGSICDISKLTLDNCVITQPADAVFDAGAEAVINPNTREVIKTEVKIIPGYELWVAGERVTPTNMANLSGTFADGTVSGNVSYNPQTKTLTLDGADITVNSGYYGAINTKVNGMKIELVGSNTITINTNHAGVRFDMTSSNSIEGSGSLTVNAPNYYAIDAGDTLIIKNCTLTANGDIFGIGRYMGYAKKLIIDNATVSATGAGEGSIKSFDDIELIGCVLTQPAGAYFNSIEKAIYDGTEVVKTEVKIIPGYELKICGEIVTPSNMANLSGTFANGTVSGNVSYNPQTKTLTLDGADISSSNIAAIETFINGLKIDVIGTNTVTSNTNQEGISFRKQSSYNSIEGSGSLTVNAPNYNAIRSNDTLVIKNCTINAIGGYAGFWGRDKLTIDNATVSATGTNKGSIYDFDDIELINCKIVEPSGAVFNSTQRAICDNQGNVIKTLVRIIPTYNLWVCGEQVTADNKDDLTVINGTNGCTVSGSVKYIPETNTLRLENANIHATTGNGIENNIDGLKIEVIGNNNTVESSASSFGIEFYKSGSIEGGGSLTVNVPNGIAIKASFDNIKITIKNCTVTANGGYAGIFAGPFSNTELVVDNATVSATGTNLGSICNLSELTLNNCVIIQPTNAVFDLDDLGVKAVIDPNTGKAVKTEVNIIPANLPIFTGAGDWTIPTNWNTGTVPDATQKVIIDGNAAISSDLEVAGFVINAGKLIVVNSGKKLTVTNKSTNNGTIVLHSSATNGTATLVGDVAGKAIVCQAAVNYRTYYLSSPVSGMVTTTKLGKYITFTESTDQWTPNPAEDFANISPVAGKGYGVQVGADVAESDRGKATTLSFTGTLNNGDVPIAITSADRRFNFLGNPYPSYLNTIKVVANPNITKSLWFYSKLADNTPYQFTAYNIPTGLSI